MPYEYLEDVAIADIAFRAWAPDLGGVFVAAADATTNVMIEDLATIHPARHRPLRLRNESLEMLLFDFLNEIVYLKDAEQLLVRVPEVHITSGPGGHALEATAAGEPLDPERHATRVDVKAVTLYRFGLRQLALEPAGAGKIGFCPDHLLHRLLGFDPGTAATVPTRIVVYIHFQTQSSRLGDDVFEQVTPS